MVTLVHWVLSAFSRHFLMERQSSGCPLMRQLESQIIGRSLLGMDVNQARGVVDARYGIVGTTRYGPTIKELLAGEIEDCVRVSKEMYVEWLDHAHHASGWLVTSVGFEAQTASKDSSTMRDWCTFWLVVLGLAQMSQIWHHKNTRFY